MQFGFKIGLISRLKSTGLRKNRENRGAARDQLAHISPTAPSEMATIPRRRERNANLASIDKGLDTLLAISGSPSKKSNTNFRQTFHRSSEGQGFRVGGFPTRNW